MENKILVNYWAQSSKDIVEYAKTQNYDVKIISETNNLYSISKKNISVVFKTIDCGLNSSLGLKIADNKELTYKLAELNNINVPESHYFKNNPEKLDEFISTIKPELYPLITKPSDASKSQGVFIGISDAKELKEGIKYSSQYSDNIIIQEEIPGFNFRVLVIGEGIGGVLKRTPAYIIGNGKDSIEVLVEKENILRRREAHQSRKEILFDNDALIYMSQNGYSKDSIIENGKLVYIREDHSMKTGGFSIDCTDEIHPDIATQCVKFTKISKLQICGVDYMCNDISQNPKKEKGAIIEINATPGIGSHKVPSLGKGQNVAVKIVELALKKEN